jgi:hypothetical protein
MGFKEDEDFARFLTMGAHAAAAIAEDLEVNHGHRIVELERYARANKIWAIKVKRMRLPDLLCLRCGRRFEAKGKTNLELRLSDSATLGREWWAGGMRSEDIFAFARVALSGAGAEVGQVVYTTLGALISAKDSLVAGQRKAVSAGSEVAVSWPSWASSSAGVVEEVGVDGIRICREDGRSQRYRNHLKWPNYYLYRQVGDAFRAGDMIVSSVEPASVPCRGEAWDWFADLASADTDDRFAAIKAARWLNDGRADSVLRAIADDPAEDWRPSLEAAASLSLRDPGLIEDIVRHANSGTRGGEAMEAVFVLTELPLPEAGAALERMASAEAPSEVRAAAVWGLGLGASGAVARLLPFLADEDDLVALHASAALPAQLSPQLSDEMCRWLIAGTMREATAAAHALSRRGETKALISIANHCSPEVRALILRAVGDRPRSEVEVHLGEADPETIATLRTLWIKEQDWLRSAATEGGLEVLERQRLRL